MRLATGMNELESDNMIVPLMQYQRIMDDIREAYKATRSSSPASLPTHAESLSACLDAWWAAIPTELHSTGGRQDNPS